MKQVNDTSESDLGSYHELDERLDEETGEDDDDDDDEGFELDLDDDETEEVGLEDFAMYLLAVCQKAPESINAEFVLATADNFGFGEETRKEAIELFESVDDALDDEDDSGPVTDS